MTHPEKEAARAEENADLLGHVFRRLVLAGAGLLALAVAAMVVAWLLTHH